MKIISLSILAMALTGVTYAGAGCCPVSAGKTEAKVEKAADVAVKVEVPATSEVNAAVSGAPVMVAAADKAVCGAGKSCDTKKDCGSCTDKAAVKEAAKPACQLNAADKAAGKTCADGCGCKA